MGQMWEVSGESNDVRIYNKHFESFHIEVLLSMIHTCTHVHMHRCTVGPDLSDHICSLKKCQINQVLDK